LTPLRDDVFVHRVSRRVALRKVFDVGLLAAALLAADILWALVVDDDYPVPLPVAITMGGRHPRVCA
jgi:hypothetical protein